MWDVFLTFHITPIDVSIALKLRPVAQKCLLAYFVLKIAIISTKRGGGADCKTWRNHHVARPQDHLESSKLDTRCILMGSILIFWNF